MKYPIAVKIVALISVIIILMIPLSMIDNLVSERQALQREVIEEIAKSSSGEQQVLGPFILMHFKGEKTVEKTVAVNGTLVTQNKKEAFYYKNFILPTNLSVKASLASYEKYRSLYKALLYNAELDFSGVFEFEKLTAKQRSELQRAEVVFYVKDPRGLIGDHQFSLANKSYSMRPGAHVQGLANGVHVPIALSDINNFRPLPFSISLPLRGMKGFSMSPLGHQTELELVADWPHPSFFGRYLPVSSSVNEHQFSAIWQTSVFATNMPEHIKQCIQYQECGSALNNQMGVHLIDGVSQYQKNYRAINYALMIIVLVFSCFFLAEMIKKRVLHPVQYAFVGIALALFYLLLLSLSEHLGFNWAYLIAASASVMLLSGYLASIFKQVKVAIIFFVGLSILYGMIFVLLQAESYSLLLGSVILFMMLSAMMFITRDIDWYQLAIKSTNTKE